MNKTFAARQLSFLSRLTAFSLLFFGLHSIFIYYFLKDHALFYSPWQIYLFHFVTVFFIYTLIHLKYTQGKKILSLFMVFTFLKMTLAVVFLLPLLFSEMENKQADVFSFFIPYFLFLAIEVYNIADFLRKT